MKHIKKLFSMILVIAMLCACARTAGETTWQEQYDLGVRYLAEGKYQEAILAFEAAIEIDPKQPAAYAELANVYLAIGDPEQAVAVLERGIAATGDAELEDKLAEPTAPGQESGQEPARAPTSEPTPEPSLIASGTCGENLIWTLDGNGTLTIRGTGKMTDYSAVVSEPPWKDYSGSIKNLIIEDGVTHIGSMAFTFCRELTGSLIIPDSVTSIGRYAFKNRNGFTGNLQLSKNLTTIETEAFYDCSGFTGTLLIPGSVLTIEDMAFWGCSGFEKLVITNGVSSIGNEAFAFCFGVERGPLTIPGSVTFIGAMAFSHMGVTEFLVENENAYYSSKDGVLFDKSQKTLVMYPEEKAGLQYIIPDGVTEIADGAFEDSGHSVWVETLESVVFPESVSKIGWFAFINCGCVDYYFRGNAPSITFHSDGFGAFTNTDTLYYTSGAFSWTDSAAYDEDAGTWNGYKLAIWDGEIMDEN